jgi:Family of unknown function (DUF5519)
MGASRVIEQDIFGWPGVTTEPHRFGGVEFRFGRIELGHLHGDKFADLPFPKRIRDELIATGRASIHQPLPNSGWVRKFINEPGDVQAVIELFRMNYDRVAGRKRKAGA